MENAGGQNSCGRCGQSWDYTKRVQLANAPAKGQHSHAAGRADRGWKYVQHKFKGGPGPRAGWIDFDPPGPGGRPASKHAPQGAKYFPTKFDEGTNDDSGEFDGNEDEASVLPEAVVKAKALIKEYQNNIDVFESVKGNLSGTELDHIVGRIDDYRARILKAQLDIPTPKPSTQTCRQLLWKAAKLEKQVAKNTSEAERHQRNQDWAQEERDRHQALAAEGKIKLDELSQVLKEHVSKVRQSNRDPNNMEYSETSEESGDDFPQGKYTHSEDQMPSLLWKMYQGISPGEENSSFLQALVAFADKLGHPIDGSRRKAPDLPEGILGPITRKHRKLDQQRSWGKVGGRPRSRSRGDNEASSQGDGTESLA